MGRSGKGSPAKNTPVPGDAGRPPPKTTNSTRSSPRKGNGAVIKLRLPEKEIKAEPVADAGPKPIKLTLKLGSSLAKSTTEDNGSKATQRITPKLTLSLRRPSTEDQQQQQQQKIKEEAMDLVVDDLPRKRGRKPAALPKASSYDAATADAEERQARPRRRKDASAPPSFANSKANSLAASSASLPSAQQPASTQPQKASYQVPVYSEEDRLTRQVVNEIIQDRVTMLQAHRELWDQPCGSVAGLMEALWPFYEQLAVTEVTHSGLYRQAAQGSKLDDLDQRHRIEYEQILDKFNAMCLAERNKVRETELVVLEHRLCLEEEKFLYTKLKNDYYSNYASIGGRKPTGNSER